METRDRRFSLPLFSSARGGRPDGGRLTRFPGRRRRGRPLPALVGRTGASRRVMALKPPPLPQESTSRPVSRVLYGGLAPAWRPFLWDAGCPAPLAVNPDDAPKTGVVSRAVPIRLCSRWGLPCRFRYRSRGGLLPHRFTLARASTGGLISVALSLGSPPPDVIRHRVSVEPGLSSMRNAPRPPGRLVRRGMGAGRRGVKGACA